MSGNLLARTLSRGSFTEALGEQALLRAMLSFESALALSQAETGVIPTSAAEVIAGVCARLELPAGELAAQGRLAGSLAIPFVKALTAAVGTADPKSASFVHYGSTSQDVLDSAMMVCLRPCMAEADFVLGDSVSRLAAHARRHATDLMLGRTMLQPATPITAGLKIARWASALNRSRERLASAARSALQVQLGGPVGSLDAFGARRVEVRRAVAARLGLADAASWHSQRDKLLVLAAECAVLVASVGKLARDLALLSQAEVGEMLESVPKKGVGGSSAMPHKRNPVACLQALAAATRAPGLMATLLQAAAQEHERAIGGWQAELATLPELVATVGASLDALERIAAGLVVNTERMRANLESLQGLVYSERLARLLMRTMDRTSALSLVDDWCSRAVAEGRHLREVAGTEHPGPEIDEAFSSAAFAEQLAPLIDEELAGL